MMAVALCAAACTTTTAFAEDDFGIESASPVMIADPVNPQPGMLLSGYIGTRFVNANWLKDSIPTLQKAPAIKTVIDKSEDFSLKSLGNTEANVGMWSGFLKCKRAGAYTITLSGGNRDGYSVRVNGKPVIAAGKGQMGADASFKVGWNKVEIVSHFAGGRRGSGSLSVVYKPKESLSDARPLTPAMLFHDQKPEEEW